MMMMTKSLSALPLAASALLMLGACSSVPKDPPPTDARPAAPAVAASAPDAVSQAVMSPFNDLNLVRNNIPAALNAARKAPYGQPSGPGCEPLRLEIETLNAALGADLDVPPTASNPGLIERGSDALGDAATGALRGAAEGVIPFRGWVRKLSGAEKHWREALAAIAAGTVRRAYLKGLGQANGCVAPAAPVASR